jgi:uncharacterized membrane protein
MESNTFVVLAKAGMVLLGLSGFLLASYIWRTKRKQTVLVCPLHGNCEDVIHSEYSRFFGVPVEVLGMAYYFLITIFYFLALAIPHIISPIIAFAMLAVTLTALMFSAYLTFIQLFTLKQLCSWCLTSAGLSLALCALSILSAPIDMAGILTRYQHILLVIHGMSVVAGFGGAIVTDMLFFRFLKDLRISTAESAIMSHVSQLIWAAIAGIVLSGIGLVITAWPFILLLPKFQAKMLIVAIIITNGALLHFIIRPKLSDMFFGELKAGEPRARLIRRLAFALGAISSSSWLSAFILGSLDALPLSFPVIAGSYSAILLAAIIGSQTLEHLLARPKNSTG